MKLFQLFLYFATVFLAVCKATAIIDPGLQQRFIGGGGEKQNVMISFTQNIQSVINQINSMSFPNDAEKRTALTDAQEAFTNAAQAPLKTFLNTMGVKSESFWINNKMVVQNADSKLINSISRVPGVAKIEKEPVINLEILRSVRQEEGNSTKTNGTEWGVMKIHADQVWETGNKGKGIVVATIDTGVRATHVALKDNFRKSFGWLDPYLGLKTPYDDSGHGTHVTGTIVGKGGIGVAPEATWIACKGCTLVSCVGSQLMECGQWVQCPYEKFFFGLVTRRNCSMAPQIVSNSWGGGSGSDWYDAIIASWQASNIIPVFAIGNAGPDCGTANSPGDRKNVIAVGSTEKDDQISEFSSLGPTTDGRVKPDISAPGGKIRSAWNTNDTAFNTISGTSMACPHVSGVVALMKHKNPNLTYKDAYDAIIKNPTNENLKVKKDASCGNITASTYPNNVFGYGLIDALKSVSMVKETSPTTTPTSGSS